MKGIILAGGSGTRLAPLTNLVCKQLLPVYDKPMIYYPLSTLMLAGIREILIISTPESIPVLENLFGDGKQLGLNISYKVQKKPNGIAQAFVLGKEFIKNDPVCLILGDNIFYANQFGPLLRKSANLTEGACVFSYRVNDPSRFGVIDFDKDLNVLSIEEKPTEPKTNYAVVGLYFYDNEVIKIAENLKPSKRGEYEITDINLEYLKRKKIKTEILGRGCYWIDTGTIESLFVASNFLHELEQRNGFKVACIEEVAWQMNFITKEQMLALGRSIRSSYGDYLLRIAEEPNV